MVLAQQLETQDTKANIVNSLSPCTRLSEQLWYRIFKCTVYISIYVDSKTSTSVLWTCWVVSRGHAPASRMLRQALARNLIPRFGDRLTGSSCHNSHQPLLQ